VCRIILSTQVALHGCIAFYLPVHDNLSLALACTLLMAWAALISQAMARVREDEQRLVSKVAAETKAEYEREEAARAGVCARPPSIPTLGWQ
jgi:hypothetical protein